MTKHYIEHLNELKYHRKILPNKAVLIVIPQKETKLAAVNLLYKSGSRNEHPEKTGLAHLMEHLMFSGTKKYPKFDIPITKLGGVNNAFTNQDVTNYYILLPAEHIELAIDIEADRLQNLIIDDKSVEVQKSVVVEEFNQRYINQPYGDLHHLVCSTAYERHNYRWPTIGLSVKHIKDFRVKDIEEFYELHYNPANLIITIAGDVNVDQIYDLVDEYFVKIPAKPLSQTNIPAEPPENRKNKTVVEKDVPASVISVSYPIPGANFLSYEEFNFLADILGQGIISRLHNEVVRNKKIFTRIYAGTTGTIDPGLFTITGILSDNADPGKAVMEIESVFDAFISGGATNSEMKSVANSFITSTLVKRKNAANRALDLAMAEFEGDHSKVNSIFNQYLSMSKSNLIKTAEKFLIPNNRIEVHYLKK